ncbi:MAG: DUF6084 family protein [Thermoleophilaceae bacterium]
MAGVGPGYAPELSFSVREGGVLEHAAVPTLRFAVAIDTVGAAAQVRSVALNVELRIAATRRRYEDGERDRLIELFGPPGEWGRNLRTLHWTALTAQVPPFTASTEIELPVTCTYDLEVSATRYFSALDDGEVPLEFLFSGTVFYAGADGRLQVGRIGWDKDAEYRLPVSAWRAMIDRYFPDSAWVRLRRDRFDRLAAYKAKNTLLTWDQAIDRLFEEAGS